MSEEAKSGEGVGREHPRDPFHGITLARILDELLERHGWDEMGKRIPIRCFTSNPSINSSLKFLRRTPWARTKVEDMYLRLIMEREEEEKAET